jgi:WD40 repeat protein
MAALIPNTTPIRTFEDHGDRVVAVAALHGERMVTGSYDGMLRLWDLKTGVMLKKMEGHRSRVRALAVSPDGEWIASGDESGELIAWYGQTGEHRQTINKAHNGWIFSLHFSSVSKVAMLASGSSDTTTNLWYIRSCYDWSKQSSLSCGGNVRCVRFSPGRPNYLAVATDNNIRIYQDPHGHSGSSSSPTQLVTEIGGGFNYSLAWTPDSSRLFSGGNGADPTIREWNTSNWHQVTSPWQQVGDPWKGHFKNIHSISFNSNGTFLASASDDNRVRLWRLSDRRTIAIFKHSGEVNCVAFSANDNYILSGGVDKKISEWSTSENMALPEDDSKDGLMKEQATHKVSLFSSSCPYII